ncbi:MAG: phage tail assembly chaperone [Rhodobacteraceae bacterium]|nr:phage tail assembly chaperone [Paracoccaceae bacterium]
MKFVLADAPRYWWPVTVKIPNDDQPGEFIEQTFKLLFEPRDREEEKSVRDRILGLKDGPQQIAADRDALAEVIKGWDDVVGPDKAPVEFTSENLDRLLRQSWAIVPAWKAYHESQLGGATLLGN